jgi:hypothetical protein
MAIRARPCSVLPQVSKPTADELAAGLALQMPLRGRHGQRLRVRIMCVTCGAMGIRTPDLLHAIGKGHGFNRFEVSRPLHGGRQPGRCPGSAAAGKHGQGPCDTSWAVTAACPCRDGDRLGSPGSRALPDGPWLPSIMAHGLCRFSPRETPRSWPSSLPFKDGRRGSVPGSRVHAHGQMSLLILNQAAPRKPAPCDLLTGRRWWRERHCS